jgi:hypothetical protein
MATRQDDRPSQELLNIAEGLSMTQTASHPKPRRGLSTDRYARRRFESVADDRGEASCRYSMADTLMGAYSIFATEESSILSFENLHRELHIEKPFGIDQVPSNKQIREILDGIDIDPINEAFTDQLR